MLCMPWGNTGMSREFLWGFSVGGVSEARGLEPDQKVQGKPFGQKGILHDIQPLPVLLKQTERQRQRSEVFFLFCLLVFS